MYYVASPVLSGQATQLSFPAMVFERLIPTVVSAAQAFEKC